MRKLLLSALLMAPLTLSAHEYKADRLVIDHPWGRPTAPNQANGAAYVRVRNAGDAPDRLLRAASEAARAAELHETNIDGDGVARMRPVPALEIPAGGEATLSPGGVHIMLLELKAPMREGERVPLVLTFERAGDVRVDVSVERSGPAGGEGAAEGAHQGH